MATRAKDTAPQGKEKRGISPSHPIPHYLRSPNSSTTNSPVRKRADSTTSNKNAPNYLKPIMSSSGNSNNHNKHTLTQRRSFDKPLVSQKNANPKERILRSSSSFSGKTSSISQKPLSDRLSRLPHMTKDATGKQHGTSMYVKPGTIKKTTTTDTISKKKEVSSTRRNDSYKSRNDQDAGHNGSIPKASTTNSSHVAEDIITQAETGQDDTYKLRNYQDSNNDSTPKASVITDSPHAIEDVIPQAELSGQEDNQELQVTDTERDMVINNSETAASDDGENNSAIEDQEDHNGNVNNAEIVVENQVLFKMEEPEEEQLVEEISTSNPKEPEEINNELHLEENTVKVVDENQQEKEEDEVRNQGKEAVMAEEGEAMQETNTTVASSEPQCQVVQGKKESVVSNDMIEETASKLREQRKNRVKALAGAFETVISLQEPKA